MTEPMRFYASDLWSKYGFGDGDGLGEWIEDHRGVCLSIEHEDRALKRLVREHLLPAMAAAGWEVEVEEIGTCHNPIRAASFFAGGECPEERRGFYVEVTPEEIDAAVEATREEA